MKQFAHTHRIETKAFEGIVVVNAKWGFSPTILLTQ
jgi:hypothetical protein